MCSVFGVWYVWCVVCVCGVVHVVWCVYCVCACGVCVLVVEESTDVYFHLALCFVVGGRNVENSFEKYFLIEI